MHELFSHLGLRFYLFELQGDLKYTHTRNNKACKIYEICTSDIEDGDDSDTSSTEDAPNLKSGIDESAVGIQLRLIKNDGLLKIEFEGRNGASAEWTFNGMELLGGGSMVAAAATQTDADEEKCLVCGEEKRKEVEVKHEETQTVIDIMQSVGMQTAESTTRSVGVQASSPIHHQIPQAREILGPFIDSPAAKLFILKTLQGVQIRMRKLRKILDRNVGAQNDFSTLTEEPRVAMLAISRTLRVQTNLTDAVLFYAPCEQTNTKTVDAPTELKPDTRTLSAQSALTKGTTMTSSVLKRKASTTLDQPVNKRAKSTHNSQQWPRHLYMDCFRNMPIFKGDVGTLHIDVQEGTAFFEGWYGKEGMRVQERKQIDLRDMSSICHHCLNSEPRLTINAARISYEPLKRGILSGRAHGIGNATHDLCIDRLNAKRETVTLFYADCSAPGWKTFGLDTAYSSFDKPSVTDMTPISNANIIVDALVYCIDVTSRREAVHDPDIEHKLLEEVEEYKVRQKSGRLDSEGNTDWEWTLRELTRREHIRKRLRVVEGDPETASSGAKDFEEFLRGSAVKN
jgi:hypothetical protein